ncbi:MAG: Uma2 family endonuclease [Anaerolineae bacterium]
MSPDDRVELLEGWLIPRTRKTPAHVLATNLIREAIEKRLDNDWFVNQHQLLTILDSEPEPDVVVVRGKQRDFVDHHPMPQDVALVIEVADATLQRHRTLKKRLYARAGIPSYWIVNLVNKVIEVYSEPSGVNSSPDYAQRQEYRVGNSIILRLSEGQNVLIAVAAFMP